jgi:polyvinyl alcohol dehydrogenase (cytochrome)
LWNSKMIDQPIRLLGKGPGGLNAYGPSGAAVWAPPTADLKRGVLYVGTSHQISGAPQPEAHAIVALDLKTGQKRWIANFLEEATSGQLAHPGEVASGRDGDFNTAPVLVKRRDGKEVLLVGNKESYIYALNPDQDGKVIWRSKVGVGGSFGGINYGLATDGELVFAPLADIAFSLDHRGEYDRRRRPFHRSGCLAHILSIRRV